jgi:hydrophobic/amphiphilic exporter-1 (mainly G- bacteria), HAE1 family
MVDFFIHRPVFSTVCALLIILAGAVCIPTLPIAQFPSLAPPQVGVTAIYTGASSQTVESAVTTPLEQQINGAEGMKYITSSSTNNGVSSVTATFDITRDPDLASVDIQNRVNTAQGRLPNAVKQIGITVAKTSQNFVFGAGVFSPDGRFSTLFMSNYLDVYVRDTTAPIWITTGATRLASALLSFLPPTRSTCIASALPSLSAFPSTFRPA